MIEFLKGFMNFHMVRSIIHIIVIAVMIINHYYHFVDNDYITFAFVALIVSYVSD